MKENNIPKELAYYWYHIYKDKYTDEELKRNDKRSSELAAIEEHIISNWGFIENYSFTNKMELRLEYSSFYHDLDYTSRLEMITNLSVFKEQYDKDRNVYITSHERKEGTELIQRTPSISAFVSVYNIYRKLNESVNGKQIKSLDRKLYGDDYCDRVKQTLLEFKKIDFSIMPPFSKNPFIKIVEKTNQKTAVAKKSNFEDWRITINPGSRTFTFYNQRTKKQLRSVKFDDLGFRENKNKENIHIDYLRSLAFLQDSTVLDDHLSLQEQINKVDEMFPNSDKKRTTIQKAFREKLNIAEGSKMFQRREYLLEKVKLSYHECVCNLRLSDLYKKQGELEAMKRLDKNLHQASYDTVFHRDRFRTFQRHLDLFDETEVFQRMIDDVKVHAQYMKQKKNASDIDHFDDDIQHYLNQAEDEIEHKQNIIEDVEGNLGGSNKNPHDPLQ